MPDDPYAVLGVSRGATAKEIRTAYRDKCLLLHPDRRSSTSPAAFQALQAAWETLRDDQSRRLHDRKAYHTPQQRRPRYERELDETLTTRTGTTRRPPSQTSCAVPVVGVGTVGSGGSGESAFHLPVGSDSCVLKLHPCKAFGGLPGHIQAELLARLAETALPPGAVPPARPCFRETTPAVEGALLEVVGFTYFTLVVEARRVEDTRAADKTATHEGSSDARQLFYGVSCLVRDGTASSSSAAGSSRLETAGVDKGEGNGARSSEVGAVFALSSLPLHALLLERLHGFCEGLQTSRPPRAKADSEQGAADGALPDHAKREHCDLPRRRGASAVTHNELASLSGLLGSPSALGEPSMLPELLLMGDHFDPLPLLLAGGGEVLLRTLKLLFLEPRLLVQTVHAKAGGWRRQRMTNPSHQVSPEAGRTMAQPLDHGAGTASAPLQHDTMGYIGSPLAAAAEASAAAAAALAAASGSISPAPPSQHEPPSPHLASSVVLCIASLLPNGLLSLQPPPPLQPIEEHLCTPCALGKGMLLLPSVSHWDVFRLLPHGPQTNTESSTCGERGANIGWLAGAPDEASGRRLAPLAQAILEVRFNASTAGEPCAEGCGLHSLNLSINDPALRSASRLTASEAALASRLEAACRDGISNGANCNWEGSGGWVRAQLHAHFAEFGREAAANVLMGNAAMLSAAYGSAFVRYWARTFNFADWATAAGVHGAARLWRARLDSERAATTLRSGRTASLGDAGQGSGPTVGAREVGGRLMRWFRNSSLPSSDSSYGAHGNTDDPSDVVDNREPDTGAAGVVVRDGDGVDAELSCSCNGEHDGDGEANGSRRFAGGTYAGGTTRRGERQGPGVWWSADKQLAYLGEWLRGVPHGDGAEVSRHSACGPVAEVYVGAWAHGERHGWGRGLSLERCQCYTGEWVAGEREGEGIELSWVQGDKIHDVDVASARIPGSGPADNDIGVGRERLEYYEGSWRAGLRSGFGVSVHVGREKYEGEWSNGERCGVGRCIWPDGVSYAGEWFEDERHGAGTLANASGERIVGWWAKGELVSDFEGDKHLDADAQVHGEDRSQIELGQRRPKMGFPLSARGAD